MKFKPVDQTRIEELEFQFPTEIPATKLAEKYAAINEAAKAFARAVIDTIPWSVDRDRATQAIREAAMWARESLIVGRGSVDACETTTESGHQIRFPA